MNRLSLICGSDRPTGCEGKTAVIRYTRLRYPRSGEILAGWLRIFGGSWDVADRARSVVIRIRWVCGGWWSPYLRENRTSRGAGAG